MIINNEKRGVLIKDLFKNLYAYLVLCLIADIGVGLTTSSLSLERVLFDYLPLFVITLLADKFQNRFFLLILIGLVALTFSLSIFFVVKMLPLILISLSLFLNMDYDFSGVRNLFTPILKLLSVLVSLLLIISFFAVSVYFCYIEWVLLRDSSFIQFINPFFQFHVFLKILSEPATYMLAYIVGTSFCLMISLGSILPENDENK